MRHSLLVGYTFIPISSFYFRFLLSPCCPTRFASGLFNVAHLSTGAFVDPCFASVPARVLLVLPAYPHTSTPHPLACPLRFCSSCIRNDGKRRTRKRSATPSASSCSPRHRSICWQSCNGTSKGMRWYVWGDVVLRQINPKPFREHSRPSDVH